jgi:hypothetical protein
MKLPRLNRILNLPGKNRPRFQDQNPAALRRYHGTVTAAIRNSAPCAIGKVGTTELMGLEYLDRRIQLPWPRSASWYRPAHRLYMCSGVFPTTKKSFLAWAETYHLTLGSLDVVGQWQPPGTYLAQYEDACLAEYAPQARRCGGSLLTPFHPLAPWITDLLSLRWLVITPFVQTAKSQLDKLPHLGIYPRNSQKALKRLSTHISFISSPPFAYMKKPVDQDWGKALERLKGLMETKEFDVALIGAGAWSLPLAVHAKTLGRKGIHLGGITQLLFGIRGGRYDCSGIYDASNKAWTRPLPNETPRKNRLMENGAYW